MSISHEIVRDYDKEGNLVTKCYFYHNGKNLAIKDAKLKSILIDEIKHYLERKNKEVTAENRSKEEALWNIYSPIPERAIIIRGNNFYCYKNHNTKEIGAVFNVINKNGKVRQRIVPAGYCQNCGLFLSAIVCIMT